MVLQERAKVTREAIIAGAAMVFQEHGYGNTSLTQVSETAQVTKGALYFHFRSKEELALAVIDEQHRLVVAASQDILARNLPALTTMILMCRAFGLQLVREPVVKAGIRLTLEATAFDQQVRGPYDDWIATMADLAERGRATGQIRSSLDPVVFSRFLVASFTGVQMVSDVLTGRDDVMQRIQEMWAILLPSIMQDNTHEAQRALYELITTHD